jgi:hypothetical protein
MQEAIDAIVCTTCLADKGQPCIVQNGRWNEAREFPHSARTSDYYKLKRQLKVQAFATIYGTCTSRDCPTGPDCTDRCMKLAAQGRVSVAPVLYDPVNVEEGKAVNKKSALERQLDRIMTEIDKLELMGEDVYEDETVLLIKFKHPHSEAVYDYVVFKAAGRWYMTGYQNQGPRAWSGVVEYFAKGDIVEMWMNTGWEQVL